MELLYIIYTHNRPMVLQECLRTLFSNNDVKPDRIVIIDDGSKNEMKESIYRQLHMSNAAIDFLSFKPNVGYGRAAEIGFAVATMLDPKYCFILESDYIFRKHGLDEVMDVLRGPDGDKLVGVAGYSHPDFFDPAAKDGRFVQEYKARFGQDMPNREVLYKPFPFKTRFGQVNLQFTSNCCGTMYLNWKLISDMRKAFYPRMEREWIDATCCKGKQMRLVDDGAMSQALLYFWTMYARQNDWDTSKSAALIDIMPSVANHICGGGISANVPGMSEGRTFVSSPSFPQNYNEYPKASSSELPLKNSEPVAQT